MEGSPSEAQPGAAALISHDQILRLERNLLAAAKSKGPFDPSVRRLRTNIRDSYEALILHDRELSESLEVEQALWRLHYREIEGFRFRIRKILLSKAASQDPAALYGRRRKKGHRQEPLVRLLTAFKSFLGEASGFFHGLLIKLRLRYGLTSSLDHMDRISGERLRDELRSRMVSCHRIQIYLGDLARYKELYAIFNPSARDWSVAANYYKQAAFLWPASGNPYNQLAVLCTYSGSDLMALYYYCRSLAVSVPFATAWDNVALLFEKNKQNLARVSDLQLESNTTNDQDINSMPNCLAEQDLWSTDNTTSSCGLFGMYFVKLVGILLTQSSIEGFNEAVDLIEKHFHHFLTAGSHSDFQMKFFHKLGGSIPLALQVIVILIFCMHHISGLSSMINQEQFLSTILKFAFQFASLSVEAAENAELWSVFSVAIIFMEWLTSQPKAFEMVRGEVAVSLSFTEFCEKLAALDTTLINKVLVNDLSEDKVSRRKDIDDLSGSLLKAQWEDHELLGFLPLAPIHLNLEFSKQLPRDGSCDFAMNHCWKLRYRSALQKVMRIFPENPASACLRESLPERLSEASLTRLTAEDSVVDVHPALSLKEWFETTFFSADVLSKCAYSKQPVVRHGIDTGVHEVVCRTSEEISSEMIVHFTEPVLNQLKGADKRICSETSKSATFSEVMMTAVSLSNNSAIAIAGVSELNIRGQSHSHFGGTQPVVNPSNSIGCGFPISSRIMKTTGHAQNNQGKERELFPDASPVKLPCKGPSKRTLLVSSHFQEDPIESTTFFDDYSHVQPARHVEATPSSSPGFSTCFTPKRKAIALAYSKVFIWSNKSYKTQNPFVHRIKF